ncbi:MAG: hypothetical protein JWM73_1995, partial [Solirubrobacterales bacterium]|nr:hypothetical protein [Solirubrobacterales bacterium]
MRNALLQEATALPGGDALRATIWTVFTARGMGFFAGTTDSDDTSPAESFVAPPDPSTPTGALAGTVTDAVTGRPVSGASEAIGGHTNGDATDVTNVFTADSAANGAFTLAGVPVGTYKKVVVDSDAGYDARVLQDVGVSASPATVNVALNRDWSSAAGGGSIASASDTTGDSAGCGPAALINQSQGAGWSPFNPATDSSRFPADLARTAPTATIALPRPVDISSFGADPGATCGDGASATARQFTIETSRDGATFTLAYDGRTDGAFAPADAGRMRSLVPAPGTGSGVRFVRLTLLSPQDDCTGCDGRDFIDFSELEVYGNGVPTGSLSVPAAAVAGHAVTLDASSFTDDGALATYDWDFEGDGSFDQTTVTPTTTHAYATVGSFTPQVRVTDTTAGSSIASAAIAITAAPPVVTPKVRPRITIPRQSANRASFTVRCQTRCTVRATLKAKQRTAKLLHLHSWTLGTRKASLRAGTTTVRIALKKPILRKLRAHKIRHVTLTLTVRVNDTNGLAASVTRSPRIPISKR